MRRPSPRPCTATACSISRLGTAARARSRRASTLPHRWSFEAAANTPSKIQLGFSVRPLMATACRPMLPAASTGKPRDEDGEYLPIATRVCFGHHHCGARERRRLRSRARTAVASRHHRAQERRRLSGDGGARRLHGQAGPHLDLPHFQNDVIALRALLAGELESYEGGAATAIIAAARNADVKII